MSWTVNIYVFGMASMGIWEYGRPITNTAFVRSLGTRTIPELTKCETTRQGFERHVKLSRRPSPSSCVESEHAMLSLNRRFALPSGYLA